MSTIARMSTRRVFRIVRALFAVLCAAIPSHATIYTVTIFTDSASGGAAGTGLGAPGDLRSAILAANVAGGTGNTIEFACGNPSCTIVLNGPLPPITSNLIIDGGRFGNIILDGNSAYRVFFVDSGNVTLTNLQIQNAWAQGGAGGNGYATGGGGGLGAGAGLFVNRASAIVAIQNTYFLNCSVAGGIGGAGLANGSAGGGGGGGGGLAFAGGNGTPPTSLPGAGGGGGGVLGVGGYASTVTVGGITDPVGGAGGAGGGGGGSGWHSVSPDSNPVDGPGGSGYAGDSAGANGANLSQGGAGGFGGGGGGGGNQSFGGTGGFGGGGGGVGSVTRAGGPGGAGGGGGAGFSSSGLGGQLSSTLKGGDSGIGSSSIAPGGGGGGAAAGPAIFVTYGSVTILNSTASGTSATGGAGGAASGGNPGHAGSADATPVFNYAGSVNGSTIAGPAATALPSGLPATHFNVVVSPNPVAADSNSTIVVTALDPNNSTSVGYNGTVTLSTNNASPVFPALPTFTSGTSQASGLELKQAGSGYTVTATDTTSSYITGSTTNITVNAGPLSRLAVSAPSTAGAGTSFIFSVTAQDAEGNTETSNHDAITFSSSDSSASLPIGSTLSNGVGSFQATLNTFGTQTITVNDATAAVMGTSGQISVSAATAPQMSATFRPSTVAVGGTSSTTLSVTITNPNAIALSGISVSNAYPMGLAYDGSGNSTCGGNSIFTSSGWSLSGVVLAAHASCVTSVEMHGTAVGMAVETTGLVSAVQTGSGGVATATLNVTSSTPSVALVPLAVMTPYGNDEKIIATLNGAGGLATPTGTVTLMIGGMSHTLTLNGGSATYDAGILPAGSYMVTGSYSGDNVYGSTAFGSSAEPLFVINKATSNTQLSLSSTTLTLGQNVTLSATVTSLTTGVPTGQVSFYDGNTLLGISTLTTGTASFATSSLTSSTHAITAVYSGDTNFTGSNNGTAISVVVAPADFNLTLSVGLLTIHPGESGNDTFQIAPVGGLYPGAVSFSVSGLPAGASATFSPTTLAQNAGAQTVTLIIKMPTSSAAIRESSSRTYPILFSILLLPLAGAARIRRSGRILLWLLLLVTGSAATTTLSGCGSDGSQNYPITVTATSGGIQRSATGVILSH